MGCTTLLCAKVGQTSIVVSPYGGFFLSSSWDSANHGSDIHRGLRIADVVEVHPTQVSDVSPRFATDTSGAVRRRQLGG